jgi:hypothetical protein
LAHFAGRGALALTFEEADDELQVIATAVSRLVKQQIIGLPGPARPSGHQRYDTERYLAAIGQSEIGMLEGYLINMARITRHQGRPIASDGFRSWSVAAKGTSFPTISRA